MTDNLLEIKDLHVMYRTDDDEIYALNGVDLAEAVARGAAG